MKAFTYPEYGALFQAWRGHRPPGKVDSERSENFLSDTHGRDHEVTAELALSAEGGFAVRVTGFGNMGAFLGYVAPMMPTLNVAKNLIGVYAPQ